MYGLRPSEMLMVWGGVSVVGFGLLFLVCAIIAGCTKEPRRRAKVFPAPPAPRDPGLWVMEHTVTFYDPPEEMDEHVDGLIYALADQGDEKLEIERSVYGREYKTPKDRRKG